MLGLGLGSDHGGAPSEPFKLVISGIIIGGSDDEHALIVISLSDDANQNNIGVSSLSSGDRLTNFVAVTTVARRNSDDTADEASATENLNIYYSGFVNVFYLSDDDATNIGFTNFGAGGSATVDFSSYGPSDTDLTTGTDTDFRVSVVLTKSGFTDSDPFVSSTVVLVEP